VVKGFCKYMSDFYGVNTQQLPSDERFIALTTTANAQTQANLGAECMHAMFGLDKSMVYDTLQANYELLPNPSTSDLSVVGLNLVDAGQQGITPAQLVAGYNKVASSKRKPAMYLWDDMYAKRGAAWYNHRHPQEQSHMTTAPLFGAYILGATTAPEGLKLNWEQQQKMLLKACKTTDTTATEGMTPQDAIVADAMTLISPNGRPRIDINTLARFVQHQQDIRDGSVDYGPYAFVGGSRLDLDGFFGYADGFVGFRRVVGPAKA
jgi:hypothetical protein